MLTTVEEVRKKILGLSEFQRERYHFTNIINVKIFKAEGHLFCFPDDEQKLQNHFGIDDWQSAIKILETNGYVPNHEYLNHCLGYNARLNVLTKRLVKQNRQANRTTSSIQRSFNMAKRDKINKEYDRVLALAAQGVLPKNKLWLNVVGYYEKKIGTSFKQPEDLLNHINNLKVYQSTFIKEIRDAD